MPSTASACTATGSAGRRQLDLQPRPAVHPVGLAGLGAVHPHPALPGQFGGAGPRQTEHAGQRGVQALALEAVGDGETAEIRHGHHYPAAS